MQSKPEEMEIRQNAIKVIEVAVPEGNRRAAIASSAMGSSCSRWERTLVAGNWVPKGTSTRDVPYGTPHLVSGLFLQGTRCARLTPAYVPNGNGESDFVQRRVPGRNRQPSSQSNFVVDSRSLCER